MDLPSYFKDYLRAIRPTKDQLDDLRTGHKTLRDRLREFEDIREIYISDFLQGSYRRATAVRPAGESRSDVDIIVVTSLDHLSCTPQQAIDRFIPFVEKYYKGKYEIQGRSIGIELSYVALDLVVTAAPDQQDLSALRSMSVRSIASLDDRLGPPDGVTMESAALLPAPLFSRAGEERDWRASPLQIPDREAAEWKPTHPLEQIRWTWRKNEACNGHYVNVVKALKRWRREVCASSSHPKSYPLEHLIGACCPDGINSIAEGVTLTLETIVSRYGAYAATGLVPSLPDHGVPEHDVMARVEGPEFAAFHADASEAAALARRALDSDDLHESANLWRELLGSRFPEPPEPKSRVEVSSGGFTRRQAPTSIRPSRFA